MLPIKSATFTTGSLWPRAAMFVAVIGDIEKVEGEEHDDDDDRNR
ncbi:MAG TPA: hypothetical protein VNO21_04675 [Polyangiaceae bacterium]|nr:hypothetical protein [Polyangiaceae bacterium]